MEDSIDVCTLSDHGVVCVLLCFKNSRFDSFEGVALIHSHHSRIKRGMQSVDVTFFGSTRLMWMTLKKHLVPDAAA